MKTQLLFAKIWFMLLMSGCNSHDTRLTDIPAIGRIAYIITTQNPTTQEEKAELSSLNIELEGEIPYYPEKPSTFITTNSKSKRNENYIIRFEKNLPEKTAIADCHNKALSEMKKYSSRNGYITSFTLKTINDNGDQESAIYSKKNPPSDE